MARLTGKVGSWEVPHAHMWKDRARDIRFAKKPLIGPASRIATIGSCFAAEIAAAMSRLGLNGAMHPTGLFYNTRSIRQEIERVFGKRDISREAGVWPVKGGFVHPLKDYRNPFATREALVAWSDGLDAAADQLFKQADVVVMTLGLIESWKDPATGLFFREIPHPDVFERIGAAFTRLTVAEMVDDLVQIRAMLREQTKAELIITVSPVPLHATLTSSDVRVANTESKSRIRAAVSELIDAHPDVHYFHSYEIVTTAERLSDFMLEDGRHVSRPAVDYILAEFLRMYSEGVAIPDLDLSWLTAPHKVAERVVPPPPTPGKRVLGAVWRQMPEGVKARLRGLRNKGSAGS